MRKLGSAAPAPVFPIVRLGQCLAGLGDLFWAEFCLAGGHLGCASDVLADLLAGLQQLVAVVGPQPGDRCQNLPERRHIIAAHRREICASPKWRPLRRQEYAHRPAPLPGHSDHGIHVNTVQVRSFFPVHFDIDKMLVHHPGGVWVFEGFMFHDMAPVAGCVANAQKDRFIFLARFLQRFISPGVPVHRVIGMLE